MKTQHAVLIEDPEFQRLLSVETLAAEASEVIARLMAEQNLSKADLARRLNKSRAWVTQLLSGKANMTVRTLAEVAYTPVAAPSAFSTGGNLRRGLVSPILNRQLDASSLDRPKVSRVAGDQRQTHPHRDGGDEAVRELDNRT